ncbi:TetR/AcrR family transcriptional regulator [Solidesulfovibrio sp.]|uniref:TetR/AcrR family transcriptional regulator n=1 Tax=Solidesulfovibrio sp. TaxID=2910990 RepID=UPI002612C612|nr:TetR/AcrR family transcriptional regulator [Solidesulfovibrio sp.]
MARVKTEARREAFLDAAREVFQEMGFDQASMDVIAARAGSSKATLYRYFDSKETLFMELVRRMANAQGGQMMSLLHRSGGVSEGGEQPVEAVDARALLDPEEDVAAILTKFGQHVLKAFHTPQALGIVRMVIAAAVNPEIGRLFYEQGPARAVAHLAQYIARVIEAGRLRQADPHIVAYHFYGLLESEVHQAGLFNVVTQLDDARIAATVARAMEVFLRAYGRPPCE